MLWREAGHTTAAMGWLNQSANESSCRNGGHATLVMGWLKIPPNVRLSRACGHETALSGVARGVSSTSRLSSWGQTTDSRPPAADDPRSRRSSDLCHSSLAALCSRSFTGRAHVKRRARTTGTRLETPASMLLHMGGRVCTLGGDHTLRGVWFSTCKCTTGIRLHALQNSSDASCSSRVEAYQRFSRPSEAWFRAMMKASRHRLSPRWYCAESYRHQMKH